MIIASVQVENFKSFRASPEVLFGPGCNVIVGPNNAGKTAFLEAMQLRAQNKPHLSTRTVPSPGAKARRDSLIRVQFKLTRAELFGLIRQHSTTFYYPVGEGKNCKHAFNVLRGSLNPDLRVNTTWMGNKLREAAFDTDMVSAVTGRGMNAVQLKLNTEGDEIVLSSSTPVSTDYGNTLVPWLAGVLRDGVYYFQAERLNLQVATIAADPTLQSDARNLASVLHLLQSKNPARYERLNDLLTIVFPDIKQVTVPPLGSSNSAIIQVWGVEPSTERADLAVPLGECGTGIGQVLAMLYVVLTSDNSRVFLIDEPQSFLHPGAVRKLLELLRGFPRHQYVLTTHSPTVVACAEATTCHLVSKKDNESSVLSVAPDDAAQVRLLLSSVGARLSDVFGADNVLWVEGRTEELCFPGILRTLSEKLLRGTQIMGIVNTGDLRAKKRRAMLEVYERLSKGTALLPTAIGFILDREEQGETSREDLAKRSGGKAHYLPRRMYENYLIVPEALAAVVNGIAGFSESPVSTEEVEAWIKDRIERKEYFKPLDVPPADDKEARQRDVHGARLLSAMFGEMSDQRVSYDKVAHGVELTHWILANSPESLREIADLMETILGDPQSG